MSVGGTACLWALGDVCGRYGMSVGFRGRYSLSVGGTDCLWAVQACIYAARPVRRRHRAQELCKSRGGRPGLPSLISLRFLCTLMWTAPTACGDTTCLLAVQPF